MKILLINQPDENMLTPEVPSIVTTERGHSPPLGLMYLASYIEQKTDYEVEILDAQVEKLTYEDLKRIIKEKNPDLIGLTVMTLNIIDCIKTARLAKDINPNIKVVFGGPHVNIYPEITVKWPFVDYIVLGEGEDPFIDLIENISDMERLKKIKGLVFECNGKIINTGVRPLIMNLDKLPFPVRKKVPYMKYSSLLAKRSPITTMITSRGCPYRCLFCDRPHLGKIFRARSHVNVVDEMEECTRMGIGDFLIYDDTFTIDRIRTINICKEIIKRKLDVGWSIRARVNTVDFEVLTFLKRAGCQRIQYGVEAGNQRILDTLRKDITLKQVEEAFKLTRKVGIDTLAFFMIGSPRETKETVMDTIKFANKLNPDYCHFSLTTPYPSTDLYRLGLEEGIFKNDFWEEFAKNPTKDFTHEFWEENLTKEEIIKLNKLAYKSFYTRPTYILRRMFKIRSFGELNRKIKAGLKIFNM